MQKKEKIKSALCMDCLVELEAEKDDLEYRAVKCKCPRCGGIHELAEPIVRQLK